MSTVLKGCLCCRTGMSALFWFAPDAVLTVVSGPGTRSQGMSPQSVSLPSLLMLLIALSQGTIYSSFSQQCLLDQPCLSCMICKKRLDSYILVEHNQQVSTPLGRRSSSPNWRFHLALLVKFFLHSDRCSHLIASSKSCYAKNFSTRDLRQANLPVTEVSISPTSSSPPGTLDGLPGVPSPLFRVASPVRQSGTGAFQLSRLRPTHSLHSPTSSTFPQTARSYLDKARKYKSTPLGIQSDPLPEQGEMGDQVASSTQSSSTQLSNRPTHRSSKSTSSLANIRSLQPEISVEKDGDGLEESLGRSDNTASAALNEKQSTHPPPQAATGTRYGTALGSTMAIDMASAPAGSSTRKWNIETPVCPKCSKRVYFAEQVNYSLNITTRTRLNPYSKR